MTLNQLTRLVKMPKMRNDEDEESLEAEVPRAKMNPNNPTSREKQEREDSRHAVDRKWCAACVGSPGDGVQHQLVMMNEEEKARTTSDLVSRHKKTHTHISNSDVLNLTKKVTSDKERAALPFPRTVVENVPDVEPGRFHVLSAHIEDHGHTRG